MSVWGREVAQKSIGTYSVKILHPRPPSLLAILAHAQGWGAREFLVFDDQRISFAQFVDATAIVAARLTSDGVRRGDVVLLNSSNRPEFLAAFWGALRIGAIVALGNAWWSADETAASTEGLGLKLIIADAKRRALTRGDARFEGVKTRAIETFADAFTEAAPASAFAYDDDDEEAPAVLIFTSGTTGKPKAAILTHRALIACIHNIVHFRGVLPDEAPRDGPQTTMLCCTPLFHVGGTLLQTQALLSGHRMVLLNGRVEGGRILDLIDRERINVLSTVPTVLSRILDHPDFEGHDLTSVKSISAAGAMVSPDLIARARKAFPAAGLSTGSTYGMTESGGSVTMVAGPDHARKPTGAGKPFATCELRINAPDQTGEGEIFIRAPSTMSGYWGLPGENVVDSDGWIHTGDLGRIDEEGFVHVTGRSKEIIIRGGENMAASVIEERLAEHPAVLEVAVIGLPHHDLGEEVGAVVVLRPGAQAQPDELAQFVREKLSYFQVPTKWWLRREQLPTNAVGKVFKPALRQDWPV